LIEKVLEIFRDSNEFDIVIVSGPSLQQKFENIRNLGFVNNLHEVIYAADVLVSLAGKSTIDEAKEYGTPSVFIPIQGHFEQEGNAREIGFFHDDINRLEELVLEKFKEQRNPIANNGAQKAAGIIQELLG
jgi:UDP-N-acetylglucosamine--N-acetylmuramyl-(pentapeptide) pyrophosphoryl-undecaprenol N-acetylglucosamine transferase